MIVVSKPPLVTLLTNQGNSSSGSSWTLPNGSFKKNQDLVDVLTCNKLQANSKGGLNVQAIDGLPQVRLGIKNLTASDNSAIQVLMPASALNMSGTLCPSLAISGTISGIKASYLAVGAAFGLGIMMA
jgi:alpha-amylase